MPEAVKLSLALHFCVVIFVALVNQAAIKPPIPITVYILDDQGMSSVDAVKTATNTAFSNRRPQKVTHEKKEEIKVRREDLAIKSLPQDNEQSDALIREQSMEQKVEAPSSHTVKGEQEIVATNKLGSGLLPEKSANKSKKVYLREHFSYIRDLIQKNLGYPLIAKKMRWVGEVVVSFVIYENGTAGNLRIIKTSGHELLDRNVLDTITAIQPFPRPPVTAELVLPVVYKLGQ